MSKISKRKKLIFIIELVKKKQSKTTKLNVKYFKEVASLMIILWMRLYNLIAKVVWAMVK